MNALTSGPLAGLTVVDLADESGIYGTKVMADLGADVIRVEPPGGDALRSRGPFLGGAAGPERSLYFAAMNTSKRSVIVDLDSAAGIAQLERLIVGADGVFYSGPAEGFDRLGLGELRQQSDRLVVTAVTPFGLTGPLRAWRGTDLVAWAMGGLAWTCGDPDRPPSSPAPAAALAHIAAGQVAAFSTVGALRLARRNGTGQLVDVSLQESVLAMSGDCGLVTGFLDDLIPRLRCGNRRRSTAPFGQFPARDGYVAVMAPMPAHWEALSGWIYETTGNDAVLDEALRGGPQARAGDMADVVNVLTEEFTVRLGRQELFVEGQRRGIPITPVNDAASVLADPYLQERDFWVEVEVDTEKVIAPGAPYRFSKTPWRSSRAPRLGEDTTDILSA